MSLPAGTRLGRYEVRSQIGAGGMGEVYIAEDTLLRRPAAVKVLTGDFTHSEERLHRFEREAFAASSLNHPNIVTIYDIGSAGDLHYIATEYVEGESLREHIRFTRMELREILDFAIQIASALAAAHQAGIVHRDIKPENVMLRQDGYVKILDFGLAKLADYIEVSITDTEAPTQVLIKTEPGRVMGTINYMSPEQARGLEVDSRTDIFSLGIILYEMVARRRHFGGDTKSDVLAAVLMLEPPPLTKYFPDVPAELGRITSKALRKNPEERYQAVKEMLIDLRSLKQELDFEAKTGQPVLRLPTEPEPALATAADVGGGVSTARQTEAIPTISELFINEVKQHPRRTTVTFSVIALLIATGGWGLYRLIRLGQLPQSFQTMRLTKLTFAGNVAERQVAISPDGKYVVYAVQDADQQSLWLRQVATAGSVQVVAPAPVDFGGLTFSRDGNYVYYVVVENKIANLYRVGVLGGAPRKLIDDANGPVTFSPEGDRLVFLRNRSLMLARVDGSASETLAQLRGSETWLHPAWSPDGRVVVSGVLSPADNNIRLVEVRTRDGTVKTLPSPPWLRLNGLTWLPDGSGLLLAARDLETRLSQIWVFTYPNGKLNRMTNDLSNYYGLSMTADAKTLTSVQGDRQSNIWVLPEGNSDLARRITFEAGKDEGLSGLSWTPDSRIVYSSRATGTADLWIVNEDGSNNHQLTFDARANFFPSVSPDGRYIVFVSDRTGNSEVWRMNLDGTSPRQLTTTLGTAGKPRCSPDSKWIVYELTTDQKTTLWKIGIDGGTPVQLTTEESEKAAVSPDGATVICEYGEPKQHAPSKVALIPFSGGSPTKFFDFPAALRSPTFGWTTAADGLVYVDSQDRVYNLWSQALNGGSPKQLTRFKSDQIFLFDWTADGKRLAVARGREGSDVVLIKDFK